jgi:hypothetical protein
MGGIRITCHVPPRPFPTTPGGEPRYGLQAATTAYEISADGSKKLVPSEVQIVGGGGGGFGPTPEPEWVDFDVLIPLDSKELDAEARRFLAKLEESMTPEQKGQLTEVAQKKALENLQQLVAQNRLGHLQLDCRVLDGSRVMGTDSVELEVLFKGRFSDVGLLGSPPVQCQHLRDNFQTMTIDPNTLKAKLDGPLPLISPSPDHDFYQRSCGNRISIAHLGPDGSNVSYSSFDLDPDGTLMTRNKRQVLMQGPFGTVFADSTYYYGKQYHSAPTDFHVELYFNEGSHEPAEPIGITKHVGVLSAISMIRVFRAPPEFLVVCATYDAAGRMLVLSVNGSENGNWVHPSEIRTPYPDVDFGTIYEDRPKMREYFGLPETFPIADYLKTPQNEAQKAPLLVYSDAVNLHYQRNRYVRQDIFGVDGSHTTEFFSYTVTPEDRQLEPIDDRAKFGYSARGYAE